MPSVNIPFPGLYHSWLSQELDNEEERFIEYECDENEEGEKAFPEPLRIASPDLADILYRAMDYSAAHLSLAKAYTDAFDAWAGEALGFTRSGWRGVWGRKPDGSYGKLRRERYRFDSLGAKFEEMTSPREYNFTTDRIFCELSGRTVARLFRMSREDNHARLAACIRERFTSRDGFISHYSNRLADWLEKPLADWDHNELGTLLRALLPDDDDALMWMTLEGETGWKAMNEVLNWAKFNEFRTEKRAELLRDWLDDDREAALIWRAHNRDAFAAIVAADPAAFPDAESDGGFYRCDKTPDMFDGAPA